MKDYLQLYYQPSSICNYLEGDASARTSGSLNHHKFAHEVAPGGARGSTLHVNVIQTSIILRDLFKVSVVLRK